MRGSGASVDTDTGDQKFEALQKYGTDLTAKAAQLDPVIGRDEEIRRCVRILCRRTKNNPVLIGDPGKHPCPFPKPLKPHPITDADMPEEEVETSRCLLRNSLAVTSSVTVCLTPEWAASSASKPPVQFLHTNSMQPAPSWRSTADSPQTSVH